MHWMAVDKAVLVITARVKNFTLTFRKCFDKRASDTLAGSSRCGNNLSLLKQQMGFSVNAAIHANI